MGKKQSMHPTPGKPLERREFLRRSGLALSVLGLFPTVAAFVRAQGQATSPLPSFTGPGANPYWNGVNPYVVYPQKAPLLRLTDRPVQLETPRGYFLTPLTPNAAHYVRYHLDEIPNAVDLATWRLLVEGNVDKPLKLSLAELLANFKPVSLAAVNQCSGNSRSRFQPRVAGGQWGNGAMSNAVWTGVRLKEVLAAAGVKAGTVQISFQGLDRGKGPEGKGSNAFVKALDWNDPVLEEVILAYAMNGEPLPMLNGFPLRAVVPGRFATYWMKHLTWIRALTEEEKNFWQASAYKVPDNPKGLTTPQEASTVKTVPIGKYPMPVRSFIITPDGSSKIPLGLPLTVRGIAFSGYGRVTRVEFSDDDGKTWRPAALGEYLGPYSFRTWEYLWKPQKPGKYVLAVRATDERGNVQPDDPVWNASGYMWNRIERQEIVVGSAS